MNANEKINATKDNFNKMSDQISDATKEVKKQAQQYSDEISDYIKDCPMKSVLIASAVGLLIGKFIL